MNYDFFSTLFVRTPLYSLQQHAAADYTVLLKSNEFRAALFLASKTLYDELAKRNFDFMQLTEKQRQTVLKYINRATFRSTPFGLFSTFSLVPWSASKGIVLSQGITSYVKLDFSVMVQLWEQYVSREAEPFSKFYPNHSLYFGSTDIRYTKTHINVNGEAQFSVVSIAKNSIIKKLMGFCAEGKLLKEICSYLVQETATVKGQAEAYIMELISEQILVSDYRPHITGKDYSDVLLHMLSVVQTQEYGRSLSQVLRPLCQDSCPSLEELSEAADALSHHLNTERNFFYSVAERRCISGGLFTDYQQTIREGLYCLSQLTRPSSIWDLERFREAFINKYEAGEVPLLQVLDPQFGLGYGELDRINNHYSFLNTYHQSSGKKTDAGYAGEGSLAAILVNEWHLKSGKHLPLEIEITDEHLKKVENVSKNAMYPPSLSVMFRVLGDQVYLEQAGGVSALSLIGRFSSSREVAELGRDIAAREQGANTGVLFAEIAHLCHLHTANVNRRDHLRDYEIPVLTNSTMAPDRQIQLCDIMVSVKNNTVVLRSRKLNKVIIPRLSSAYNYTKNALPIFRFLCDVQRQHLVTDFTLSFSSLVPGLKFYPRIRFKSCILQLAEWHISGQDLEYLQYGAKRMQVHRLKAFAQENNLPRYVANCNYDNFLVYDLEREEDIITLLKEIQGKEHILIKEFPFAGTPSIVQHAEGQTLLAQFVASLYLKDEVYSSGEYYCGETTAVTVLNRTMDWLYFKVYCHPLSSDTILNDYLAPLMKKHIKDGNVLIWFFIRYQDPEYHIRFRIKTVSTRQGVLFQSFNTCLSRLCSLQVVKRFQTDIYKQETDRYTVQLMPQVEEIFQTSSELACSLLKKKIALQWSDEQLLPDAAASVYKLLQYCKYENAHLIAFCKDQFEGFFWEFGASKDLKSDLERLYKTLGLQIFEKHKGEKHKVLYRLLQLQMSALVSEHQTKRVKEVTPRSLVADVIHMHLNRYFTFNQRYFEMATYYLIYRGLMAMIHKTRAAGG